MTTRPIVYEITVEGAGGAQQAFHGIASEQTSATRAFTELSHGVSALTQALGQVSPQAQAFGGVVHTLLESATNLAQGGLNPLNIATTAVTAAVQLGSIAFTSYQQRMQHVREEAERLERIFGGNEEGSIRQYLAQIAEPLEAARSGGDVETFRRLQGTYNAHQQRLREIHQQQADAQAAEDRERLGHESDERFRADNQRVLREQEALLREQDQESQRRRAESATSRAHEAELQQILQQQIAEAGDAETGYTTYLQREEEQRTAIYQQELAQRMRDHERELAQQLATQEQLNSIQEQTHQNQIARLEQQRAAYASLRDEINGYAQPLVSNFVGALSKVIAGTESADKAFQGLLSSFLQFISEQAALKAAFEFAEAIASAATFNYAGAAQHAAAGALFTVVAIAAGAGAIATAPSTAPAGAPASQPQQGGGTTNYTIIWNSPVVTAQDRAELGRSLNQVSAQSSRRFASSV